METNPTRLNYRKRVFLIYSNNDSSFNASSQLTLWRYMNFPQFVSLLETQNLYFSRADSFKDVFEGKIPEVFFKGWPEQRKKCYEEAYYYHMQSRRKTFINCWSAHNRESYALWQIYGGSSGIAIQSNVSALKDSFINVKPDICRVVYIDYSAQEGEAAIPMYSDHKKGIFKRNFFACKPKAYEYENEVRAIIMEDHKEAGKLVPVNLQVLIKSIFISPFSDRWFAQMTADMVRKRYGLKQVPVVISDIEVST